MKMGFFGQSSGFEADVENATSDKNTNENWALILEVCDKVSLNPRNAKECLKAIMKRVGHSDPHVALQAITLLDACVSNCGKTFHLEIASREFQTDFLRLLAKVQPEVQSKMCHVLKGWAEGDFKSDPELNLIPSFYSKIRQEYDFSNFHEKQPKSAANLTASKDPNVVSSQQEEDDLAKAIELSLKEVKNSPKQAVSTAPGVVSSSNYPSLYPSMSSSGPAASSLAVEPRKVRALYDFEAAEENELTFMAGEIIHVTDDSDPNWWKGYNQRSEGLFPSNFVTLDLSIDPEHVDVNQQQKVKSSTQFEEDSKELQQKTEAAAAAASTQTVDIDEQKIDRLLHLLNEANPEDPSQDTEEMLRLEQEVHQMGPLIDAELERVDRKHAKLSQLSSDLVDAINLYHSLMRDDRIALGPPYNIPSTMPGVAIPGSGYPNIMYGSNPAYSTSFGTQSVPAAMNSLLYSPPSGNYHDIPPQLQNGHIGAQQIPSQANSLQILPSHINQQILPPQHQQQLSAQQPGIYGPQQHVAANNLNASSDTQQQQSHQLLSNQHHFNQILPPQGQHFMPQQQSTNTTTVATAIPTNHIAPNTQLPQQQQPQAHNQFIGPQHQHIQQPPYMNNTSHAPSTNPNLYNTSIGDQQQSTPSSSFMGAPQNVPTNITPSSGHLEQFAQLQHQMAHVSINGQQSYQTNLPQNIPVYQQQR